MEKTNERTNTSKQRNLKIKTNLKGGFTPQPEPPGMEDLGGRDLGDLVDPGAIIGDTTTTTR